MPSFSIGFSGYGPDGMNSSTSLTAGIDLGDVSPCDATRPKITHEMLLGLGGGSEPHPAEALSAAIRIVPDAPKRRSDFRGVPLMETADRLYRHRRPENGLRRCGSEPPPSMLLAADRTADKVLGIARGIASSFQLLTLVEASVGSASADAFVGRNGVAGMLILIARRPDGFRVAFAKMTWSSHVLFPAWPNFFAAPLGNECEQLALDRVSWH